MRERVMPDEQPAIPHDPAGCRALDLRVLSDMRCSAFDFEAYRSAADLKLRLGRVTDPDQGAAVTAYRWIFRIRTHISPSQFAPVTEIGVSTDVAGYPCTPPRTWVLSMLVPWSPHFVRGAPVCIGPQSWAPGAGRCALGELAIGIAHLLNWDEKGRCPGYAGWNGAAVRHHRAAYAGRPVDPSVRYPVLPGWLGTAVSAGRSPA